MDKFTLSFEYKGRTYTAAVKVEEKPDGHEFVITLLDGELDKLLSDNPIIREVDGTLEANVLAEKKDQTELKLIIASRLSEYLRMACFVGDECLIPQAHVENWEEL